MDIFSLIRLLQISIIHNCVSQFALLVVAYHTVRNTELVSSTILLPSGHYFHREKPVIIIEQCEDKQIILLESRIEFVSTIFRRRLFIYLFFFKFIFNI